MLSLRALWMHRLSPSSLKAEKVRRCHQHCDTLSPLTPKLCLPSVTQLHLSEGSKRLKMTSKSRSQVAISSRQNQRRTWPWAAITKRKNSLKILIDQLSHWKRRKVCLIHTLRVCHLKACPLSRIKIRRKWLAGWLCRNLTCRKRIKNILVESKPQRYTVRLGISFKSPGKANF